MEDDALGGVGGNGGTCLIDDVFGGVGGNGTCLRDDDLAGLGSLEDPEDCLVGLGALGLLPRPIAVRLLLSGSSTQIGSSSTQIGSFGVPWLGKSGKLPIRGVTTLEPLALGRTPGFIELIIPTFWLN